MFCRHIYRIDGHLIRPYFEKHCLSVYAKRKGHQVTTVAVAVSNEIGVDHHRDNGSSTMQPNDPIDSKSRDGNDTIVKNLRLQEETEDDLLVERDDINYEKETNFMLNVIVSYFSPTLSKYINCRL